MVHQHSKAIRDIVKLKIKNVSFFKIFLYICAEQHFICSKFNDVCNIEHCVVGEGEIVPLPHMFLEEHFIITLDKNLFSSNVRILRKIK